MHCKKPGGASSTRVTLAQAIRSMYLATAGPSVWNELARRLQHRNATKIVKGTSAVVTAWLAAWAAARPLIGWQITCVQPGVDDAALDSWTQGNALMIAAYDACKAQGSPSGSSTPHRESRSHRFRGLGQPRIIKQQCRPLPRYIYFRAGRPTRSFCSGVICAGMRRVFVSHASADAELVDKFVDRLLRNGCNLGPDDLFYSSGEDTGVPSGEDLIATVRKEVSDATLVIAVITPTYQTRPICIAELGAAWGRAGHLMPLMLPGLPRSDLEGVLAGMTIKTLEDSGALDELHDRVRSVTGVDVRAATWNRHKQRWQRELPELLPGVPRLATITPAEVEQLRRDVNGARAALDELEAERRAATSAGGAQGAEGRGAGRRGPPARGRASAIPAARRQCQARTRVAAAIGREVDDVLLEARQSGLIVGERHEGDGSVAYWSMVRLTVPGVLRVGSNR